MTQNSENCRPYGHGEKRFLTVKEVAEMLRVSQWTVYSLIRTDGTFPYLNIGLKKKFVVEREKLSEWTRARSKALYHSEHNIPLSQDLLKMGLALNE